VTDTANDVSLPASGFWTVPDHSGEDYYTLIARLHRHLQPKTYLEIGVLTGDTLALAKCHSIAVDPRFEINQDVITSKPTCLFFQMTSDTFFSVYDPKLLLGDRIDMALIDGWHLFEFALRDFINLERHVKKNSILLMAEVLPIDAHSCRRLGEDQTFAGESRHPEWWAGDVCKAVMALKKFRRDLHIRAFNAPPNGLVAITNFNPNSQILSDQYFDIVSEYRMQTLNRSSIEEYFRELNIQDTNALVTSENIAELFWL
jgi:hypothetical protein